MFKSPKDGKWKKVKSITRIANSQSAPETADAEEPDVTNKVKSAKKINSIKKIKSMMDIDDDLAIKMKKEVEEGNPTKLDEGVVQEESFQPLDANTQKTIEDKNILEKVDRILKMFNASSLDDIIQAKEMKSMEKVPEVGGKLTILTGD